MEKIDFRRIYYSIISLSSRINPCPSCPYHSCPGKESIGKGKMEEIVGCSRWP